MTLTDGISIIGVGHALPANVEDNETLCRNLDVTPEWILEKTGIKRRYIADPSESASEYGSRAAVQALGMAGVAASQIDLIIACTFSGDYIFPPLSAKIHQDIGATGAQTFDLQANCAGFVAGLTAASDRMRVDDSVRHALVVGVEMNSRYVDRSDVNSAIYLSDGAGAVVLGRRAAGRGILASAFFTDSSNYEAVRMRGGGSSFRSLDPTPGPSVRYMEMNGLATWKQAITHLPPVIRRACAKASVDTKDIDFLVFHQANYNLIEYVVKKMGFDLSRTFINVQEIGNTGAASVAIALSEATTKERMKRDDLVVVAAVGAGFNFGASVWRWDLSPKEPSQ
jgi:3-oxoacyl-[acyl-carrier-protein] synthase-3